MSNEVTITRGHVTLTIVGFVSMLIFVISSVGYCGFKLAEYKARIMILEKEVSKLEIKQQKISDMELKATLRSIDKRLDSIERSIFIKKSYGEFSNHKP